MFEVFEYVGKFRPSYCVRDTGDASLYLDLFGAKTRVPYFFQNRKNAQETLDAYNQKPQVPGQHEPGAKLDDGKIKVGVLGQHEPGAKLDDGKIKAGVLGQFARALMRVAEVGTFGAIKYTRGGWQSVENGEERYEDAKWRHLLNGYMSEIDPDFGLEHAAHEAWNALAKLELMLRRKDEA